MCPKEIEEGLKKSRLDLEIQVYTMDYLEDKDNRENIINKALKKFKKNMKGNKSYQYEFEDSQKFNTFKATIREHFKYIIKDCDRPLETEFKDYKGEIQYVEAFCDFYNYVIKIIDKELKSKELVKENLKKYFKKIKSNLFC